MLKLGTQNIPALYVGEQKIKRAYLGCDLVFDPVPVYTVSVSIDPAGSGTVSGAGSYREGQTVTITAEPGDGYKFVAWQENGEIVSEEESYTFTVSGDRTLVAAFEVVKLSHNLPDGYTELEYIEATGTQYINPNIYTNNLKVISFDVEPTIATVFFFFGGSSPVTNSSVYLYRSTALSIQSVACSTVTTMPNLDITNQRISVSQDRVNKVMTINGEQTSIASTTNSNALIKFAVFANMYTSASNTTSFSGYFKGKIYSYQISTASDGTIGQNNIPCIQDSTGIAGFYDIINVNQ